MLKIETLADVVCPWCYIGRNRLNKAVAIADCGPLKFHCRPYFLDPSVPPGGISRAEFIRTNFESREHHESHMREAVRAAHEDGLPLRFDLIKRQPNTVDCHRLIHWAARDPAGDKSAAVEFRLMQLFLAEGQDLGDHAVLVQAASDCAMDSTGLRKRLSTNEDIDVVHALADKSAARATTGVPTYVLADTHDLVGAFPVQAYARALEQISMEVRSRRARLN